jgi:hypothetical protein
MKTYYCTNCKHRIFFDNVRCARCHSVLAYLPDLANMSALQLKDGADNVYEPLGPGKKSVTYRMCQNSIEYGVCSWAIPTHVDEPYCRACRLNVTIPDLSQPGAKDAWHRLECSKRWLLTNLVRLGLPVPTHPDPEHNKMRFSFLADTKTEKAFTGQADGLITINVAEADNPFREKVREQMGETYRTLLGHFRHEIGHYYWDQLINDTPRLVPCRELFGDDSQSYDEAIQRHYKQGAPVDWPTNFVSSYASMHPWEDWAETWAHYLHMFDTLETARYSDLVVAERVERGRKSEIQVADVDFSDFDELFHSWVPFTVALNSLNRSMGLNDAYPFVLSERAIEKLRFVHGVMQEVKSETQPD